jgi:hypothetical protein
MRTASRRRSGKAEEEPICGHIGDDDNAAGSAAPPEAGMGMGVDPRRRRFTGHTP